MSNTVHDFYGHRLRVRVCGIAASKEGLLLVNHQMGTGDFWAPPGGGLEFGETAKECLIREMKEETGLDVTVGDFLFTTELWKPPLHAIELFFRVSVMGGELKKGIDPETGDHQIITAVQILRWEEIQSLPADHVHGIFKIARNTEEITDLRGYFKL